jgi:hypothetical protein
MKSKNLFLVAALIVPMCISMSALAAESIECSGQPGLKTDAYPCGGSGDNGRLYLNLDKGNFGFYPKRDGSDGTSEFLDFDWTDMTFTKEASGDVTIVGIVTGKSGVPDEHGGGALCRGEEGATSYSKPELLENGQFSNAKIRAQALRRATDACESEKGVVITDGSLMSSAYTLSEVRMRKSAKSGQPVPRSCISAKVQVQCNLSARANDMAALYRKFKSEFPAHSLANDPRFDALR